MIHADERKLKQVLLNLLSNALEIHAPGRADRRESGATRRRRGGCKVTDTGIGISPEDQEVVFEEFRQVGTASKKDGRHRAWARHLQVSSSSSTAERFG